MVGELHYILEYTMKELETEEAYSLITVLVILIVLLFFLILLARWLL